MNKALLSSKNMCWCTPQDLFNELNKEFDFVLDPAATAKSAKCDLYYTPETDGLTQSWNRGGAVFCNPPYGRNIGKYFHNYIYGKAEIRFVNGRIRFTDEHGNTAYPAPFPSMIVIYNGIHKPERSVKYEYYV